MKKLFILQKRFDILFLLCIAINASIVFSNGYFGTMDGGAHAYNSKILYHLIFENNSGYEQFFRLNSELVPNWFAHGLMMCLNAFLPFNLAEKIVLLIYFIAFPLLFKSLIQKSNEDSKLYFLAFPFTHFGVFYFGFYNFAFGLVFFLVVVNYWLSKQDDCSAKTTIILYLLLIVTYFTHLFSFVIVSIFCSCYEFTNVCKLLFNGELSLANLFRQKIKFYAIRSTAFIVPAIFTVLYFSKRPSEGLETFLSKKELLKIIYDGSFLISFGDFETICTRPLITLFLFLFIYAMIIRTRILMASIQSKKYLINSDVYLLLIIIVSFFFYTQPNSDGYGGFISVRFALFIFIFIVIWGSTFKFESTTQIALVLSSLLLTAVMLELKKEGLSSQNSNVRSMADLSAHIEEGSVVAPISLVNNYFWVGHNYSAYMAADKKIFLLQNYEADNDYFPIRWKGDNVRLNIASCNEKLNPKEFISLIVNHEFSKVNYIMLWGKAEACDKYNGFKQILDSTATLKYSNKDVLLYKMK